MVRLRFLCSRFALRGGALLDKPAAAPPGPRNLDYRRMPQKTPAPITGSQNWPGFIAGFKGGMKQDPPQIVRRSTLGRLKEHRADPSWVSGGLISPHTT